MRIAVLSGLEYEVSKLHELMSNSFEEELLGETVVNGTIGGHSIFNALSGAGKVSSAIMAQAVINEYMPDLVVNIGLGGGCTRELNIGDAVVADKLVYHDIDPTLTEAFSGSRISYKCDPSFQALAMQVLSELKIHAVSGTVATGDRFVNTKEMQDDIVARTGCICVDMSSAAIAEACAKNTVPLITVRVLSDFADEAADDEFAFSAVKYSELSAEIVKRICMSIRR